MKAFAQPTLSARQWWDGLTPFLTDQARSDYSYTDPANIPINRISSARILDTDADVLARILVTTNGGEYLVMLTRSPEQPQWKIDRMLPPESPEDLDSHLHQKNGQDDER